MKREKFRKLEELSKRYQLILCEDMFEEAEYKQELEVTVQDIDKEAAKLPSGKEFKVRHLFEKTLWDSYSIGSRLSVERKFINKV
ncbi:DUF1413 domain-containing protein [Bacillus cereus]|uniref:DUF1413 domain-containing protein n=1 Tax=Bacillus cereus TaxID=1396 RepID=UPI000BF26338|nr:DUF1413 domain-containing protein [Bacillus cereus]PFB62841.1 hypothetical protein CN291_20525 [Bacillus cereus]